MGVDPSLLPGGDFATHALSARFNCGRLARNRGRSLRQLERDYRASHGRSPKQLLTHARILHACVLLLAGEMTRVVAAELFYCDEASFCAAFRKGLDLTPQTFAARYRRMSFDFVAFSISDRFVARLARAQTSRVQKGSKKSRLPKDQVGAARRPRRGSKTPRA